MCLIGLLHHIVEFLPTPRNERKSKLWKWRWAWMNFRMISYKNQGLTKVIKGKTVVKDDVREIYFRRSASQIAWWQTIWLREIYFRRSASEIAWWQTVWLFDPQIQVLKDDGERLQTVYPGENAEQIHQLQTAVLDDWSKLLDKAENRKAALLDAADLHRFNADVSLCLFVVIISRLFLYWGGEVCGGGGGVKRKGWEVYIAQHC